MRDCASSARPGSRTSRPGSHQYKRRTRDWSWYEGSQTTAPRLRPAVQAIITSPSFHILTNIFDTITGRCSQGSIMPPLMRLCSCPTHAAPQHREFRGNSSRGRDPTWSELEKCNRDVYCVSRSASCKICSRLKPRSRSARMLAESCRFASRRPDASRTRSQWK